MDAGSGKPLAAKLGIKKGMRLAVVDAPEPYRDLIGGVPAGVTFSNPDAYPVDMVHLFVKSQAGLEERLSELRGAITPNGMVWVSWPKKSSNMSTNLTENLIREAALAAGLVDVKVCSVDKTWSGLKLVIRIRDRG